MTSTNPFLKNQLHAVKNLPAIRSAAAAKCRGTKQRKAETFAKRPLSLNFGVRLEF
jgi:hypothetical protein